MIRFDNVAYVSGEIKIALNLDIRLVSAFVKSGFNPPKEYKMYDKMVFKDYDFYFRQKTKRKINLVFDRSARFRDIVSMIKDNIVKNRKRDYFIRIYNSNKTLINTKELLIKEIDTFNDNLAIKEPISKRNPGRCRNRNSNICFLNLICYLFNRTVCSKLLPFISYGEEKELAESFLRNGSINGPDNKCVSDDSDSTQQQLSCIDYPTSNNYINNNSIYSASQNFKAIPGTFRGDSQMLSMTNNVDLLGIINPNSLIGNTEIPYCNDGSASGQVTNFNFIDDTSGKRNSSNSNNFNSDILEPDKTITSLPNFELGDGTMFRNNGSVLDPLCVDQTFNFAPLDSKADQYSAPTPILLDSDVNKPVARSEGTVSASSFQDASGFKHMECSNDLSSICLNQQIDNLSSNNVSCLIDTDGNNENNIICSELGEFATINVPIELFTPVNRFINMLKNQQYKQCNNCGGPKPCLRCPLCEKPLYNEFKNKKG